MRTTANIFQFHFPLWFVESNRSVTGPSFNISTVKWSEQAKSGRERERERAREWVRVGEREWEIEIHEEDQQRERAKAIWLKDLPSWHRRSHQARGLVSERTFALSPQNLNKTLLPPSAPSRDDSLACEMCVKSAHWHSSQCRTHVNMVEKTKNVPISFQVTH